MELPAASWGSLHSRCTLAWPWCPWHQEQRSPGAAGPGPHQTLPLSGQGRTGAGATGRVAVWKTGMRSSKGRRRAPETVRSRGCSQVLLQLWGEAMPNGGSCWWPLVLAPPSRSGQVCSAGGSNHYVKCFSVWWMGGSGEGGREGGDSVPWAGLRAGLWPWEWAKGDAMSHPCPVGCHCFRGEGGALPPAPTPSSPTAAQQVWGA